MANETDEDKIRKKAKKLRQKQIALLEEAGMDEFDLNCHIVLSNDDTMRIGITSGDQPFQGDRVGIQFMLETNKPYWFRGHMSPARARIIAYQLLINALWAEEKK